jgi:hypothetical protein
VCVLWARGRVLGISSFLLLRFFLHSPPPFTLIGVCEGLLYAQKAGLDLTDTIAAVGAGAAGSFSINNLGPRMVRRVLLFLLLLSSSLWCRGAFVSSFCRESFRTYLGIFLSFLLSSSLVGLISPRCSFLVSLPSRFAPGFHVDHFLKDLGIALEEARRMNLALPGLRIYFPLASFLTLTHLFSLPCRCVVILRLVFMWTIFSRTSALPWKKPAG